MCLMLYKMLMRVMSLMFYKMRICRVLTSCGFDVLVSGGIALTFRRREQKEAFLRRNFITVYEQSLALQDVDRPLTFL